MFTGIIEGLGIIKNISKEKDNLHLTISANFTDELQIDQSVAHNGICLTVVAISKDCFTVTAIKETIQKTAIGSYQVGDAVNLERAMRLGDRLDGHIVQGHVDETGVCTAIVEQNGSTIFSFSYASKMNNITIEKGSITVNGVSLTVVGSKENEFSVAIIPYTLAHTTFQNLKINDVVNLEFDVIGKYVSRLNALRQ
ncbi:riboflavin synthase subunit alpha [Polaribacter pacificus]|uniref:Riboflavin synthase n=1 Tax=Polaribacter pacificus TaxID=1775173 RepID=A0A917HYK5_9FLAO|nr:riboflavin synthase [Polaribacter pacificus]GGG94606.1 riboflavin synthase subunit alpha [Polaribacter pacificus]